MKIERTGKGCAGRLTDGILRPAQRATAGPGDRGPLQQTVVPARRRALFNRGARRCGRVVSSTELGAAKPWRGEEDAN